MPDKVKTTGRPDDCSLDELAALKEMITRVTPLTLQVPSTASPQVAQDKSCEHVDADHGAHTRHGLAYYSVVLGAAGASGFDNGAIPPHNVLLRFLRARKFDVDSVWRSTNPQTKLIHSQ